MFLRRKLNSLAGNNPRDLPSLSLYIQYFYDRDVENTVREPCTIGDVPLCRMRNCQRGRTGAVYGLCRGHDDVRQEHLEAYHLSDWYFPTHANSSLVAFRELQLRQLYLQKYLTIEPDRGHELWVLRMANGIEWNDVRIRGELQCDRLVHSILKRNFYYAPEGSFGRCALKMARACGCKRCRERFPTEELRKYFSICFASFAKMLFFLLFSYYFGFSLFSVPLPDLDSVEQVLSADAEYWAKYRLSMYALPGKNTLLFKRMSILSR